jgi:hypothetical protein
MCGLTLVVNEVLGDHNVDKQMTDSRGEVSGDSSLCQEGMMTN